MEITAFSARKASVRDMEKAREEGMALIRSKMSSWKELDTSHLPKKYSSLAFVEQLAKKECKAMGLFEKGHPLKGTADKSPITALLSHYSLVFDVAKCQFSKSRFDTWLAVINDPTKFGEKYQARWVERIFVESPILLKTEEDISTAEQEALNAYIDDKDFDKALEKLKFAVKNRLTTCDKVFERIFRSAHDFLLWDDVPSVASRDFKQRLDGNMEMRRFYANIMLDNDYHEFADMMLNRGIPMIETLHAIRLFRNTDQFWHLAENNWACIYKYVNMLEMDPECHRLRNEIHLWENRKKFAEQLGLPEYAERAERHKLTCAEVLDKRINEQENDIGKMMYVIGFGNEMISANYANMSCRFQLMQIGKFIRRKIFSMFAR